MKRAMFGMAAFAAVAMIFVSQALSQPPAGRDDRDGQKSPPPFEIGRIFPPPLLADLQLTAAQQKDLDSIKQDLKTNLGKLLTLEQMTKVENFRPRGPAAPRRPVGETAPPPPPRPPIETGGKDDKGGLNRPPRFELGNIFPPPLLAQLELTAAQQKEFDSIKSELKTNLDKLLTAEQMAKVEHFRPRGPGAPGGPDGKGSRENEKGGKGGADGKGSDRPPAEKKGG
jgi:hypothetical protein